LDKNINDMDKVKWIVLEENPKPDDYIAVMVADVNRNLIIEKKPCSVHNNRDDAMARARELRQIFGVKKIKLFYIEGHSETVFIGKA
jgi:hypothetical protein